jgi:hypothetical protein
MIARFATSVSFVMAAWIVWALTTATTAVIVSSRLIVITATTALERRIVLDVLV